MRSIVTLSYVVIALGIAAVSLVGPFPAAEAKGGAHPYEGAYGGLVPGFEPFGPGSSSNVWRNISIHNGGKVDGVYHNYLTATISGRIDAKGQMSCTVLSDPTYSFNAVATLDASGNLLGTTDTGIAFVWYRQ